MVVQARIYIFLTISLAAFGSFAVRSEAAPPFLDGVLAGRIRDYVILALMAEGGAGPAADDVTIPLLDWAEEAAGRLETAADRPGLRERAGGEAPRARLISLGADLRREARAMAEDLRLLRDLPPEARARAAATVLSRLDAAVPFGAFEPLPHALGGTVRRPSRLPEYQQSRVRPAFLADPDAAPPPLPADLGAPDRTYHPELRSCALDLCGGRWKEIYRFVRAEIEYEHAYGAGQAPELTLARGSGNDFDQAALLVALLRIAGVPCRYLYGTMELGDADAAAILPGVDPGALGRIFGGTGRPGASITREAGGRATRVFEEHMAVTAWIADEGRWVLLDPSWTPDMRPHWDPIPPRPGAGSAFWDGWPHAIEEVDGRVADIVRADIDTLMDDTSLSGELRPPDRRRALGRFVTYLSEEPEVRPELRHRLRAILGNEGGAVTSRWVAAADLRFPGFLVSYQPAAEAPVGDDWPLAALGMRARIRCDTETLAEAPPSAPGRPDLLTIEIESPDGSGMQLRKRIRAGSLTAIIADFGGAALGGAGSSSGGLFPEGDSHSGGSVIERLASFVPADSAGSVWADESARRLGRVGLVYLASVRLRTGLFADRLGVRAIVRAPAVVASSLSPVESDPSFPPSHRGYEWTLDQLSNEHAAVAVGVEPRRALDYTFGAGIVSSLLEHAALTACEGGAALSTTRLFALAVQDPAVGLRADRGDGVIRLWTAAPAHVASWSGGAMLSLEPESLAGLYELAGGIRGGVLARPIAGPRRIGPPRPLAAGLAHWPGEGRGAGAFALYLGEARERSLHPRAWWQGPLAGMIAAEELESFPGGIR